MSTLNKPVQRTAVAEQCEGCDHITESEGAKFCKTYLAPSWKWEMGQCNFATHIKRETKKAAFINPLKAAKMRARGLH